MTDVRSPAGSRTINTFMRYFELMNEARLLPRDEELWYNSKAVSRMKPKFFGGSWYAETGNYFVPLERTIDILDIGPGQEGIVAAINQLRTRFGLPTKTFAPDNTIPVPETSPKVLFHGTSFENALCIRRSGLIPQVGRFTAGAHDAAEPMIYASTRKDFRRVVLAASVASGNPGTDTKFFKESALIVLANDGQWFKASAGREMPSGAEHGDYYRTTWIMPTDILYDDRLRRFFDKLGQMPSGYDGSIKAERR